MKNLIISFCIVIILSGCDTNLSSECLFYHKREILYLCDSAVTIPVGDKEYKLTHGTVSKSGRFVAGLLVDSVVQLRIDNRYRRKGMSHFVSIPPMKFAVYDQWKKRLVSVVESESGFPSFGRFSENERWFCHFGLGKDSTIIVNTLSEAVIGISHPKAFSFSWFGDDIYFLSARSDSVDFFRIDPLSGKQDSLLSSPIGYSSIKGFVVDLVNSDCIALADRSPNGHGEVDLYFMCNRRVDFSVRFNSIKSAQTCGGFLYVFGVLDKIPSIDNKASPKRNLYRIDPKTEKIDVLFSDKNLNELIEVPDYMMPINLRTPSCLRDELLFISNGASEDEKNIYSWSTKSNKLKRLTDSGYVGYPIGRIDTNSD